MVGSSGPCVMIKRRKQPSSVHVGNGFGWIWLELKLVPNRFSMCLLLMQARSDECT